MLVSCHNHTSLSDGKAPLNEMLAAAEACKLDELGISDHLTWYPDGSHYEPPVWSMPVEFLNEYARTLVAAAAERHSAPLLRVGIEVDFFPENAASIKRLLDQLPFDYVIASVHFADAFSIDARPSDWEALSDTGRNEIWLRYWELVAACAKSRLGDFIGHLDLPKKFGFRPSADLRKAEDAALDAIAAAGSAIEINTAGWRAAAAEAYPAPRLLQAACQRGIPVLINADAHQPADLVRDFDRARALAREAGYSRAVRFVRRKMTDYLL